MGSMYLSRLGYTPGQVSSAAIGGGFAYGLEPTQDGHWSTRIRNTFLGAGVGAISGYGLDKVAKGTGKIKLTY